ncbi:MAG: hypothetical protein ACI4KB_07460, partial [Oscillospiraceae bacterium]
MEEISFIQESFDSYDDTFTWYIPDEDEKILLKDQLARETYDNPHLHIKKYDADKILTLAKHKEKNDVLFLLPDGHCTIAHLSMDNKTDDSLHFVFFSNCCSAMKYILKQYRTEYLGEKEFVLSSKDKTEIVLFAVQFILFLIMPKSVRGIVSVILGIILYIMILLDWKESGFNIIRDRKLDHVKVIPLLRYQIAYISIITIMLLIG